MQTKAERKKKKIALMDKIIKGISTSGTGQELTVGKIKHGDLNKSNISRTLKRLQEIGVLEKRGRGEYIVSEGLKEILRRKGVDIEKDNQVELLTLYESINEVFSQCTGLTEEEIKFHMLVSGVIILCSSKNFKYTKSQLIEQHGDNDRHRKFIVRTLVELQNYDYMKTIKQIAIGNISNIPLLGFITVKREEDDFEEMLDYMLNALQIDNPT